MPKLFINQFSGKYLRAQIKNFMKINFPTTYDGWLKLGGLIFAKSENLGTEVAINAADADVIKIGELKISASKKLADAAQMHKDAETLNQAGLKDLADLESEIRRTGKVLTGRYKKNMKAMGSWGFTIDESTDQAESITAPFAEEAK